MIVSASGIRGVLNADLSLEDVSSFALNFGRKTGSKKFLLARDTRWTGPAISRAAAAGLASLGATVFEYGVVSTPALFRESRALALPAIMVTASHNEPQFNGLKFIVDGGGISRETFDSVTSEGYQTRKEFGPGALRAARPPTYVEDLVGRFGEGALEGVRVAVDLGGGAAIAHAVPLLRRLGCEVSSVNDSYGVFARRIDPFSDGLDLLRRVVKEKRCDLGLAFDCDGDRLAIVDSMARKRTGDFMLTLALSELLPEAGEGNLAVSLDTTSAVDDIAREHGGRVFRAPVGEANVVGAMKEREIRFGGEGSSGGLIDGSFNYCRDSMLAALAILRGIRTRGGDFFDSVPVYHQERAALKVSKAAALRALKKLASEYSDTDQMDGLKIGLGEHSWVLIRPSGTEDVVRVSAEAKSAAKASEIASDFARKLKRLAR